MHIPYFAMDVFFSSLNLVFRTEKLQICMLYAYDSQTDNAKAPSRRVQATSWAKLKSVLSYSVTWIARQPFDI